MLKVKLLLAEYMANTGNAAAEGRQKAVNSIKDLLSQIDLKAAVISEDNPEKFTRLLTSLKGEPLNEAEADLVEEIVNY